MLKKNVQYQIYVFTLVQKTQSVEQLSSFPYYFFYSLKFEVFYLEPV